MVEADIYESYKVLQKSKLYGLLQVRHAFDITLNLFVKILVNTSGIIRSVTVLRLLIVLFEYTCTYTVWRQI